MGLVVLLTGNLGEMKWECLAIILETPLKEEWVSIFRSCLKAPVNLTTAQLIIISFDIYYFCRKFSWYGPDELWNGPPRDQHGSYGRDGPNGHGQSGSSV